jgi:hypothetical protein
MTILTAPRVRVLVAHLDGNDRLSSCAVVNEEDLPMPGWVVVARDPDDVGTPHPLDPPPRSQTTTRARTGDNGHATAPDR